MQDDIDDCLVLHDIEDFSIALFKFTKNKSYPIHDHKNMIVLTKLLKGKVVFNYYDKV